MKNEVVDYVSSHELGLPSEPYSRILAEHYRIRKHTIYCFIFEGGIVENLQMG
jgi:hypothetical protein